jgi:hypothetical protein
MDAAAPLPAQRPGLTAAVLLAVGAAFVPSAAGQAPPDASVAEARLPARLRCGQTFRAFVTMLNSGATTWTSADALGAVGGEDAFTETVRVGIPTGVDVAPGERHTFRFLLTAPDIALPQARTAWRMVGEDGAAFGEAAAQAVAVECPPRIDDAELLEADLPARLTCAQIYPARITVRNTGSTRWSLRDGYSLGAVEGGEDFHAPARVSLPDGVVVPPADVHTFTAALVAPDAAGAYRVEWRMIRPGGGFFGPSVEQRVKVVCAPRAARNGGASP